MPSINYINQSAPFWDWVQSLEQQGMDHPIFGGQRGAESQEANQSWSPWIGGFPFRPHHPHHHPHHPHGPPHGRHGPSPAGEDVPLPPFAEKEGSPDTVQDDKGESSKTAQNDSPSDSEPRRRCGPGGFRGRGCHGRGRGGPFGRGPPPWARGGFPFAGFSGFWNENKEEDADDTFKPDADVFDTESAFVVHLSVPGAKKEDVNVSWNAEKSELAISGFVTRPGDEEFLKTLAMNERKVGLFERKIRLGSLANPAEVDVDAISARLDAGILVIEIPKQDKDYVDVKMVTIED